MEGHLRPTTTYFRAGPVLHALPILWHMMFAKRCLLPVSLLRRPLDSLIASSHRMPG